jgi:hypothetical protein
MGASKRRRRPVGPKRSGSAPEHPDSDAPHHLPFGHHQEAPDEEHPHNSLQDAFENFFAGLGDFLGRPDVDRD